jgi:hypothetical protein
MLISVIPTNFGSAQDQTKYKISGYVLDSNGQGIDHANVLLPGEYTSFDTVWTNALGYYELTAPKGTYILGVWPPFDSNYINYAEQGFTVASDVNKNITLESGIKISGYITTELGSPVLGASVHFSNNLGYYGSGYFTNQAGYYFINVPAGNYTITAYPRTGNYSSPTTQFISYTEENFSVTSAATKNITVQTTDSPTPTPTATPTATPVPSNAGTEIFKLESNSTWTGLQFNSTTLTLTFTVTGESGTFGYTKAYIAKTLVPTFTGATVSLDGQSTNFTVTETASYWVFEFIYHHSTHQVAINLTNDSNPEVDTNLLPSPSPADISTIPEFTLIAVVIGIVLASVTLALTRKKLPVQQK